MHDIILILIPSRWFNSFSGACSSYHILGPKLFILFSGASSYFCYIISKLHLIHRRPWILFFSSFTSHAFITGDLMVVHHVLIHPRSLHQDSCWSSSILHHAFQLQSFLPYLFRGCYVILDNSFMFHDSQVVKNEIFKKPSFSLFRRSFQPHQLFVGVILGCISPKSFP